MITKKLMTAVIVTLAAFLGLLVPAAASAVPTTAAGITAGCYGDYCSGKDPEAMGCSGDAVTTASARAGNFTLELRWSPSCKTNWARIQNGYSGSLWVVQTTGYKQGYSTKNGYFLWTKMIYSPSYLCRGEAGDVRTGWA
ncbi:DUF2690 domain-containing protein [Actinokineospora fastidiosa]|uniref:DUF2690 domain-containing protein n=1 Tax=Actinokineospora fastidiosa TaxID=1816 RepID=A0A918GR14_9PSEU|nr:DUF2690 domain-containing protein [Actinokineospora fastidiosa]GGS54883.1 hypothetical protein GCM10010171_57540 [Actinokineospora fastidiosa]